LRHVSLERDAKNASTPFQKEKKTKSIIAKTAQAFAAILIRAPHIFFLSPSFITPQKAQNLS
jgi:hypothetical protein